MAPDNSTLTTLDSNRILIVDDESAIRDLFSMIVDMELPEIKTDTAANGLEAVKAFGEGHHAVLLMDLKMPEMDGHQAFLEIQKLCHNTQCQTPSVVFITGFSPPESVDRIVAEDQRHCLLLKPVTSNAMIDAVKARL